MAGGALIESEELLRGDDAARLFVFIHGYRAHGVESVVRVAREIWGQDVDILMPRFNAGTFSNADPFQLAREISALIARTATEREQSSAGGYEAITLCGYSVGGALLRKALVYGFGSLEDHPFAEGGRRTSHEWQRSVIPKLDRAVFLASINRGWDYRSKPKDMSWRRYVPIRVGILLGRLRMFGRFFMEMERGRPFISNLRVQWIRLNQNQAPLPPAVQLLGDVDDVVHRDDNKDLLVTKDFLFIPVDNTGHGGVVEFEGDVGQNRKTLLTGALSSPLQPLRELYGNATTDLREEQSLQGGQPATNVVFLMHGIRANADWPNRLRDEIMGRDPNALCVVSSYGYFPMLRFLLFGSRRRNVRWFMDEYTEAIAQVPAEASVHFVGHSNGTHLLAEGLRRYSTMRVDRVALMGSVVPRNFGWDALAAEGRVREVRNDRASADFIVGVFPGFFQRLASVVPLRWFEDIGDGGFIGFMNPALRQHENFYFPGGHSAAYQADGNLESLAAYLIDGDPTDPSGLVANASALATYASRLNWLVWFLLLLLLVIAGGVFLQVGGGLWLVGYIVVLTLLLLTL
jgi:hypothetical protein